MTFSRVARPPEWKHTEMGERKENALFFFYMFNHSVIIYKQNLYKLLTLKDRLTLLTTGE